MINTSPKFLLKDYKDRDFFRLFPITPNEYRIMNNNEMNNHQFINFVYTNFN